MTRSSKQLHVCLPLVVLGGIDLTGYLHAAEPTLIDKTPFHVVRSGDYRLSADLTYALHRGAAITVEADDVTIDLGGHVLHNQSDASPAAVGVLAADRQSVTVCNGTISGFYFGIDLRRSAPSERSQGHHIEQVRTRDCTYFGIRVVGQSSQIESCRVLDTGGSTRPGHTIPIGIRLVGKHCLLRNSCVRNLHLRHHDDGRGEIVGVHFDDAKGSAIENSVLVELDVEPDTTASPDDAKQRRFGIWVNGGPHRDTFLRVANNRISGFTVPLVFSPGSDGEAFGNVFHTNVEEPIRGKPTGKLSDNVQRNSIEAFECP